MRFLARGRKLGQRQLTLALDRPTYQLGEQVRIVMRVPDAKLAGQLPAEVRVQVTNDTGATVREVTLTRATGAGAGDADQFSGSFTADRAGALVAKLHGVAGTPDVRLPIEISAPRLEFDQPQVDRSIISQLAALTGGKVVEPDQATSLASLITSRQEIIPQRESRVLWNAPLVFGLMMGLLVLEWLGRKKAGLL